jgi:hypothetical protein
MEEVTGETPDISEYLDFQNSFLNEGLTILTASWMLHSHEGLLPLLLSGNKNGACLSVS